MVVNIVNSQKPDLRANTVGKLKTTTFCCPNAVGKFSRHTDMVDLDEESTSEQETPALTEEISAILSEVKALKEQVTTLKESVELVEVDPEVEENLLDGEDNDDSESLNTRVARLGSTPAEQTKDGTKSLLQDIVSELDLGKRTDSPVDQGLAKIVLSLLKDKLPEEKSQVMIDKYSCPENVEGLRTPRVNPLIWSQLPAPVRTQDSKSQKTQNALIASLVATIKATNHVLQQQPSDKAQDKELITYLTDAIALLLQCYHDINNTHRQAMRKDLHKDYAALCSAATVPATSKYLFGDLSKLTKDISEAKKLTKKGCPPQHNTARHGNSGSNCHRFLSKGRPPTTRLKKEGESKQA